MHLVPPDMRFTVGMLPVLGFRVQPGGAVLVSLISRARTLQPGKSQEGISSEMQAEVGL